MSDASLWERLGAACIFVAVTPLMIGLCVGILAVPTLIGAGILTMMGVDVMSIWQQLLATYNSIPQHVKDGAFMVWSGFAIAGFVSFLGFIIKSN